MILYNKLNYAKNEIIYVEDKFIRLLFVTQNPFWKLASEKN